MTPFQLFDVVNVTEAIALEKGGSAPEGTPRTIVEVFKNGKAFMVDLFGDWVKTYELGDFIPAVPNELGVPWR